MASNEDIGTRKLAAIMFTDIRDFSKKMGENELAAMDLLKVHDVMIRDVVAKYGGTIIKSLGDSFMVDFSSAVNAAKCAIEAQEKFWEYNKERTSFEKIEIRIGIHLGDVITVGNDIFGDGVNIAARIEAITEPTRICVSADIYNQIKNKMQIGAYSIGSIELKNIADPVEVFELLIDSIPELAQPSKSAREVPTRRKAEAITKREEEEAKRVEETRVRVDENRRQEEEDKQERANAHFAKAEEFFRAGNFDKAEEEVKEIYRIVQIHYDAQMLLLQIEEERTKREEQQRRQRVKDEKKRKEEERKQRVQDSIQRAIQHVEQDQFPEALAAIREVYTIEPNNPEAKQLEEQIRQAGQAKEELEQLKAREEEELAREEQLRLEREAAEALAKERAEAAAEAQLRFEGEPKSRRKLYIVLSSVAAVAVIAVAMLLLGHFSKPATIAVLNFTTPSAQESYLGEEMSTSVAEDLDRVERLSVISPSSTKTIDPQTVGIPEVAQTFGVSYVITGTVAADSQQAYVTAKLIEAGTQNVLWESSIQGNLIELNNIAADISTRVANALEIEPPPSETHSLTSNPQAFRLYLEGRQLIYRPSLASIDQGIGLLREAVQMDSLFALARVTLADGDLLRFEREGERDRSRLTDAEQSIRVALVIDPRNPLAYEVLGEIYRYTQQYRSAWESITRSLSLRPGNAECYRQLALLSLIAGDSENAKEYATTALSIDPRYFESSLVMGLVHLYEEDFEAAARLLDAATNLGAPDSLLTVNYKFKVWSGLDQEDKVIAYCQSLLDRANDDTKVRLYYCMGRAYQLSGSLESLKTLDDGLALAERMVTSNPADVTALAYLALLNARRAKNPELAARVIANVDSLSPGSASALYWKARVYAIQKDKARALEALAKAVAIDYRFPEVLDPDFLSIRRDPEFISTISLKMENQSRPR
jgi:class 3 adenylate cyclase/TolB-like protein/Tfp pilus assembly protein PilF